MDQIDERIQYRTGTPEIIVSGFHRDIRIWFTGFHRDIRIIQGLQGFIRIYVYIQGLQGFIWIYLYLDIRIWFTGFHLDIFISGYKNIQGLPGFIWINVYARFTVFHLDICISKVYRVSSGYMYIQGLQCFILDLICKNYSKSSCYRVSHETWQLEDDLNFVFNH